jgi:hypothetical protein
MVKWADGVPTVVILDTWQRATSGWSKNDHEAMEEAIDRAEFVAKHMNGPLLSLSHPPKDGRLTVKGAGEQEDTSTGIYHVDEDAHGTKLIIERIKGPGRGKYITFHLKPVDLDEAHGFDEFGERLKGIVAVKIGGSEDRVMIDNMDEEDFLALAWAEAIYGITVVGGQDNKMGEIETESLAITPIADWFGETADLIKEGDEDALHYKEVYLKKLWRKLPKGLDSLSRDSVRKTLNDLFHHNTKPPVVQTVGWKMSFVPKNPKKPKGRKCFVFKKTVV